MSSVHPAWLLVTSVPPQLSDSNSSLSAAFQFCSCFSFTHFLISLPPACPTCSSGGEHAGKPTIKLSVQVRSLGSCSEI